MRHPEISSALTVFSLTAAERDKPSFASAVLAPLSEAIQSVRAADDDTAYALLEDRIGAGLWMRMPREARANQLALRMMQSRIIGEVSALSDLHPARKDSIRLANADQRAAEQDDPELVERLLKWLRETNRYSGLARDLFRPAPNFRALSVFMRKTLMTTEDFDRLIPALRARAFRVWQVSDLGVIRSLRDQIRTAVEDGVGYRVFVRNLQSTLDQSSLPRRPMWHAQTVYQTNVATAYADAKNAIINTPVAREMFPYRRYMTRGNSSVRPTHRALHGLVYPSDHAFWATYDPPWDYNCRCWTELVPESEAAAADVQRSLPDVPGNPEFTRSNPGAIPDTIDDDLSRALREEFERRVGEVQ